MLIGHLLYLPYCLVKRNLKLQFGDFQTYIEIVDCI